MTTVKEVLDVARQELGEAEHPPGSNHTKYGTWWGVQNVWCGMFVSWCFDKAGLLLGPHPKGFSYTPEGAAWFQNRGKWTKTPKPGYVVFFNWPGRHDRIEHVGIVESVEPDSTIHTIEGNSSDAVRRRSYPRGDSSIVGYGIPDYAGAEVSDWFERATPTDLETIVRQALNEGTAYGQRNWAGTSKATLSTAQGIVNLLNQEVVPRL
jgi:surface antigen